MEKIEELREEIDFLAVANLSRQIKELAEEAANLAQKLNSDELSREERESLGSELIKLVNKGSDLSDQRAKIFSRY